MKNLVPPYSKTGGWGFESLLSCQNAHYQDVHYQDAPWHADGFARRPGIRPQRAATRRHFDSIRALAALIRASNTVQKAAPTL